MPQDAAKDVLKKTADVVAQQKAMEGPCRFLPHGCRLFSIESGWESRHIAADPKVATAASMLDLEAALRDENIKVIFIPADAMMADADIEKICRRNGATKTLFKEVRTS